MSPFKGKESGFYRFFMVFVVQGAKMMRLDIPLKDAMKYKYSKKNLPMPIFSILNPCLTNFEG